MTVWQRRVRLVVALIAVVTAVIVVRQLKPRVLPPTQAPSVRTDRSAVVEVTEGRLERTRFSRQDVSVAFKRQLLYENGSMKLFGVRIETEERDGTRTFTARGDQGEVAGNEAQLTLDGNVEVTASDGLVVRTGHALYDDRDGLVRATGPVQFARGRMKGSGVGMTYDKNRDVLAVLEQAAMTIAPGEGGGGAADVTSAFAEFARQDRYARFENGVRIVRDRQTMEAAHAVAYLTEDGERIDTLDLRENARVTVADAAAGALQGLSSATMTLKYGPDGQTLQQALLVGNAEAQLAGNQAVSGRRISAGTLDVSLAPDGSTPTSLIARQNVQLTMPAEAGTPARTIDAPVLEARGSPDKGLTNAHFAGGVRFVETGRTSRTARSESLDAVLKPAMSGLDDARFAGAVRFEEGKLVATSAAARYDLTRGTLELRTGQPAAPVPRVWNDQIAVDAAAIDVTLEGPKVKASGPSPDKVKSVLQPAAKASPAGAAAVKMPSMLKQDQPVNVTAATLDYDGTTSTTVYEGGAQLWQGDTSIKGEKLVIDGKAGDLSATAVASATVLEQHAKDGKKKERVRSTATAKDLKYEDALRRLTYTGDAHMIGPEGDMTAATIELYLTPSGDELERAEAYEAVTLREQNRRTTGTRMTYTTADERYVIVGEPVRIVDQCERETTGRTLTFVKATDRVVVDGNQETRTQTKGGGKCS